MGEFIVSARKYRPTTFEASGAGLPVLGTAWCWKDHLRAHLRQDNQLP